MNIGTLTIEMAANVARLKTDMEESKRIVTDAMSNIQQAVNLAKTAFITLGGVGSVMALKGIIDDTIQFKIELGRLSQQTGASVEALSAIGGVAKMTGTNIGDVGSAINKLQKNLATSNEDGRGAAQAIKALGLSFEEIKSLKPDEQMLQIAKAMDRFEDGGGKAAAAQLLFGKSGATLLPMLKELAEKNELVGKTTSESAEQALEYEKNINILNAAGQAWRREMVDYLLPILSRTAKAIREAREEAGLWAAARSGIQMFFTGDDQYKNDKALTDQTERLLTVQRLIGELRSSKIPVAPGRLLVLEGEESRLKEAINTTMAYRKVLQEQADVEAKIRNAKQEERRQNGQVKIASSDQGSLATADPGLAMLNALQTRYEALVGTVSEYEKIRREIDALDERGKASKHRDELLALAAQYEAERQRQEAVKAAVGYDVREATHMAEQRNLIFEMVSATNDQAAAIIRQTASIGLNAEQLQRLAAQEQVDALMKRLMTNATTETRLELERLAVTLKGNVASAMDEMLARQKQLAADPFAGIDQATKDYADKVRNLNAAWRDLSTSAITGFEDNMAAMLTRGQANWKSYFQSIAAEVVKLQVIRPVLAQIFTPGSGLGTGALKGLAGGGLSSLQAAFSQTTLGAGGFGTGAAYGNLDLGGFFANGGRPPTGMASVVGERGPELFIPDSAGSIIPNGRLGGTNFAPVTNIQIDSRTDRAAVYADVSNMLKQRDDAWRNQLSAVGVLP